MSGKSGELYFFECSDEVAGFFSLNQDASERLQNAVGIVSFDVEATSLLRDQGLFPVTTVDLFGKCGHEKALERSNGILQLIKSQLAIEDRLGLSWSYCRSFLFFYRLIIQEIILVLEVMQRACDRFSPECILVPDYRSSFKDSKLKISSRDRILGMVSNDFAYFNGIRCKNFSVGLSFSPSIRSSLHDHLLKLGNELLFRFGAWRYNRLEQSCSVIMALGTSYGMSRLVSQLEEPDDVVTYVTGSGYLQQNLVSFLKGEWISLVALGVGKGNGDALFEGSLIESIKSIGRSSGHELFEIYGINLWEITEDYIHGPLSDGLRQLAVRAVRLSNFLERKKPCLVMAQHALGLGGVLGELSLKHHIPSILISHGSHVPVREYYDRIEWVEHSRNMIDAPYKYTALQTLQAEAFIEQIGLHWSQPLKTGPLLFGKTYLRPGSAKVKDRLLGNELRDKNIVIHASTPKSRSSRRFYVYETVEEYVDSIQRLIRAVEKVPGVHLIVRFRPSLDLSYELLSSLLPDSTVYSIRMDGDFSDFLAVSDLLISFGSTTIEEALLNEIPVLQYDHDAKYMHIESETCSKTGFTHQAPCYHVDQGKNLVTALQWIVSNHLRSELTEQIDWEQFRYSNIDGVGLIRATLKKSE